MGKEAIVIHQSKRKLLKLLPLALLMFAGSGLLLRVSILNRNPFGVVIAGIAVAFFGPAFFILACALIRPSYLRIDDWGVHFRFYSVEMAVPWKNIQEVSGGVGWPSLTFYVTARRRLAQPHSPASHLWDGCSASPPRR